MRARTLFLTIAAAAASVLSGTNAFAQQAGVESGVRQVTLAQALQRSAQVDPNYVTALNQVGDAAWGRRAAWSAFALPSVRFLTTGTRFSTDIFNVGTGEPSNKIFESRLEASYRLFDGGARVSELNQARAAFDGAVASEREARFQAALDTESDYYDVLAEAELAKVTEERVRRAEEQFEVARARVMSGAAVQSDSLQLFLELTEAKVELLRQQTRLRVARFQLGRRIGEDGAVDAVTLAELPSLELPITEAQAVAEARGESPRVEAARAEARVAESGFGIARSAYLPQFNAFWQWSGFDEELFGTATTRSLLGVQLVVPIWNNGQREVALARAGTERAAARARRDDTEREVVRDVVQAYQGYEAARAAAGLAKQAVVVATENLRVQSERYRAGATTIIDLLTAQVDLADAEAGLVRARYTTRLGLASLEAILGRRLIERGFGA